MSSHISGRLGGTPADGTKPPAQPPAQVIWVEGGDEVLVHLDSIQTRIQAGMLLVSVDLESDQTGRATMVVPLALGSATDPAGLVAVTDHYPRGNGLLASRWGEALQAAVWATILGIASDHAGERGAAPAGISTTTGTLTLHAGPALTAAAIGVAK